MDMDIKTYKEEFLTRWESAVNRIVTADKEMKSVAVEIWCTDCDGNTDHLSDWAETFYKYGIEVESTKMSVDINLIGLLQTINNEVTLESMLTFVSNIFGEPYDFGGTPEAYWRVEEIEPKEIEILISDLKYIDILAKGVAAELE